MKALTIVAFGDSITQAKEVAPEKRWPELLRAALQARMPGRGFAVVNAGVGGNTSREGLARIERDVLAHRPDWVLVEFGGNDATHDPARHVPPDEFAANMARDGAARYIRPDGVHLTEEGNAAVAEEVLTVLLSAG